MAKITVIACGYNVDNGKPTQRGASATSLHYVDDHDRQCSRTISELVGNSTGPQCDIKAAILGLMSIKQHLRKLPIELIVSHYVAKLLEFDGNDFKVVPKTNSELVKRLREKTALLHDLKVTAGSRDRLQSTLDIAKSAIAANSGNDTGTVINENRMAKN